MNGRLSIIHELKREVRIFNFREGVILLCCFSMLIFLFIFTMLGINPYTAVGSVSFLSIFITITFILPIINFIIIILYLRLYDNFRSFYGKFE